jgi:hypothetical protein
MEVNLQQQHASIRKIVREYRHFIRQPAWRVIRPDTFFKMLLMLNKSSHVLRSCTSSAQRMREMTKLMFEILYSTEEKNSPYYNIGMGPYQLHKLSCFVQNKYPDYSYEHLLKVNEIWDLRISARNPAKLFAIILAAGSLLLKTVPQVGVETLNIDYARYQIVSFGIMVASLVFITILIVSWYATKYERYQENKHTKEIIDYTVARIKAHPPNQEDAPGEKTPR